MMVEDLESFRRRMEGRMTGLSRGQQRIASYLLTHYDEAAFLSAAELAERLELSEATVVRFAREVGYAGYPDLRRGLQVLFRNQVAPAARLQHKLAELASHKGHVLTKVVDMEVQYLTEAARSVSQAEFDRAVGIILNAQRVFVSGGGPSAILADMLELRLRRFGIFTLSMTETGRNMIEKLQLLKPGDAVVATGFQNLTNELAAVVEHAHTLGCPVVLITDTLGAALHGRVDVVLAARRGPVSTFHSLSVPMAIMNALILAVAMARPEQSLAALERMQQMRIDINLDGSGKIAARRS
jgi:DNA-binding MurR/RpiR family transcriptional regulator